MTRLLRARDIAEQLGISRSEAYKLIGRELPAIVVTTGGRGKRVHQDDLDAWVARKRQDAQREVERRGVISTFEAAVRRRRHA